MGENGNGNDSMGVGREWAQESHFRTPLIPIETLHTQQYTTLTKYNTSRPIQNKSIRIHATHYVQTDIMQLRH